MIPSVIAAVVLLQVPTGRDTIRVHEWGVVLYAADSVRSIGAPAYDPFGAVCVDAPVVYFHGAAFTGDVTVCSLGDICSVYPEPDAAGGVLLGDLGGLGSAVRWEDLSVAAEIPVDRVGSVAVDGIPIPGFGWAMGSWRVPGASWVTRGSDGFRDRFLYYEVDLGRVGFPLPLAERAPEGTPPDEITPDVLVFRRGEDGLLLPVLDMEEAVLDRRAVDESPAVDMPVAQSMPEAFETVRGWATGLLTGEEIQALWATWEPYILYGDWRGDSLLVFPIPQPLVERISTIIVSPDADLPVVCNRFFLGMKASG